MGHQLVGDDWVLFSVDHDWGVRSGGDFVAETVGCYDCLDEEIDCVSELVAPAVLVPGLAKVD